MMGIKIKGELLMFWCTAILIFLWGSIVGYTAHIVVHDALKRNICGAVE